MPHICTEPLILPPSQILDLGVELERAIGTFLIDGTPITASISPDRLITVTNVLRAAAERECERRE